MRRYVRYEPEHVLAMTGFVAEDLQALGEIEELARMRRDAGPGYTLLDDGVPVACFGVARNHSRSGEIWGAFSADFPRYWRNLVEDGEMFIDMFHRNYNFRRIQAVVASDNPKARRFIEYLGFRKEGVMSAYFPDGSDADLYSHVWRYL